MSVGSMPWVLAAAIVALLTLSVGVVVDAQGEPPPPPPPRIVVVARQDVPVDGVAASAVAAQLGGVVLVTDPAHLGDEARQGLIDLAPDLVILAGGTRALSDRVQADVEEIGVDVRRVGGETREETARLLAELLESFNPAYRAVPRDG